MSQYDKTTEAKSGEYAEAQPNYCDVHSFTLIAQDAFSAGRASAKESLEIAVRALEKIMHQPFEGSWDMQAAFICEVLAAIKERGDYP